MRDADALGDRARVVDVLSRTTGAFAMRRAAVVVKLQRHPDHVVAFGLEQGRRHRRIDTAGHGDDDAGVGRAAVKIEAVAHGWFLLQVATARAQCERPARSTSAVGTGHFLPGTAGGAGSRAAANPNSNIQLVDK
jgi:hypothetical protein